MMDFTSIDYMLTINRLTPILAIFLTLIALFSKKYITRDCVSSSILHLTIIFWIMLVWADWGSSVFQPSKQTVIARCLMVVILGLVVLLIRNYSKIFRRLKKLLNDGIDPNRGGGRLFTAPLNNVVANEEERRAASMSGTSSGSSYGDGPFTLVAKQGIGDISNISEVEAVMVNSSVPKAVVDGLRQDFPDMKFGYAKELPSLLSGGKQSNNVQAQVTELEQQFKNEKSVAKKAQIRKQITELQNGLTEQAQGGVPPNNELQNNSDATQKNKAKNPVKDIALKGMATSILSGNRAEVQDMIEALGITEEEIASIQPDSKDNYLDRDFKYLPTADRVGVGSNQERAIYLPKTKGKKAQWQRIEDDYVLAMDGGRFVDLPKMTREQAIQLSNRDGENKYYDVVPRAYANHLGYKPVADIKNLADSTQETAPPNAAPNTEDLVSVTTTDGETHMVLASELNDSNVKNLTKFSAQGKRVAAKLPRGRIASTSEQSKQPQQNEAAKQGEATKTEATKTEATKTEATPKPKAEASENRLVSDDRAAELRARLKAKLSQLNSGIDPEILAIGAELAVYHIERGARKFSAFAKNIANDLGVSVDKIRPYLRSWYNGARDMMEDMGADIQGMDSAETVRAELAKLDNPQQQSTTDDTLTNEGTMTGKTETVVTPAGREFEVRHKVVEASDLITSNLDSGAINAEYPQALQPRDRTTLKSVTQVNDIANKLNPKLLGDSASSTNGAPIVSSDNEVESGNGRTLAIRKAYQAGKADAYKAWLAEQGYDVANMQQPILVRERITPMNMAERVAYTTESNERDTLDMSPSEQAMSDAPKVMDILHLVQGGSFNNTANRDFVNAFLTGVASKNERGTMLDKDGVSLTQDGYRRIESALLAAAFNDAQIISQVIESKDSDIKAIGNALIEAAPQWAQVRKGVQEGILVEGVNVEANLVEAVHLVRKARQQNLSLSEMLNQDDIFDGSIDQVTKDFISIFYSGDKLNKARSSQKVADALKS